MTHLEQVLLVLVAAGTSLLLAMMIVLVVGIVKLIKTIRHIAKLAEDGTKNVQEIIEELRQKIGAVTFATMLARIFNKRRKK